MSIHLYIGPMYAGKTSTIMKLYTESISSKIIIDHDIIHTDGIVKNHDNKIMPCIKTPTLMSVLDKMSYDEIYINEGQFFPDLLEFVMTVKDKNIYIAGLDGDFRRKKIGQILDVIPLCDTVTKLHSRCECGKDALFSYRTTQDTQQYLLDETCYIPMCRICYEKKLN